MSAPTEAELILMLTQQVYTLAIEISKQREEINELQHHVSWLRSINANEVRMVDS